MRPDFSEREGMVLYRREKGAEGGGGLKQKEFQDVGDIGRS